MYELRATVRNDRRGPLRTDRFPLKEGEVYLLGRSSRASLRTSHLDLAVSGSNAHVRVIEGRLHVDVLPKASRAYQNGVPQDRRFTVPLDQSFLIGNTRFTFAWRNVGDGQTVSMKDVFDDTPFPHHAEQMAILTKLFEKIQLLSSDDEACDAALGAILDALPRVRVAALVQYQRASRRSRSRPFVSTDRCHWRGPEIPGFEPAFHVVETAITSGNPHFVDRIVNNDSQASIGFGLQWSACAPLLADPDPCFGLYVAAAPGDLGLGEPPPTRDQRLQDIRLLQVVAAALASKKLVFKLQRLHENLGHFLPRPVREILWRSESPRSLDPQAIPVTFLFCDLRDSCRLYDDWDVARSPLAVWREMNRFLESFTNSILAEGGLIENLMGDAVHGFWGWPEPMDQRRQVQHALVAARRIQVQFREFEEHSSMAGRVLGFGIGIATGTAVVGRLGTTDLFKIGVFGKVPSLAARLESFTKAERFGLPILVTGEVHDLANADGARSVCHYLATVKPHNMEPVRVAWLLPPQTERNDDLYNKYDRGRMAFEEGDWSRARDDLAQIESDFKPARYLLRYMKEAGLPTSGDRPVILRPAEK